jgi:dihydropteroate synthase
MHDVYAHTIQAKDRTILFPDRPLIMGVVNVTADSFFDGGRYVQTDDAIAHAIRLIEEGADLIDVGAESTRPGSDPIDEDVERRRLLPVVKALSRATRVTISIDTTKSSVARAALEAGAQVINDVSALRADPRMAEVVAQTGAGIVLMHMQGIPKTMQDAPRYEDVVGEISAFFVERMAYARERGIAQSQIVLDPGIGFGKLPVHNLTLLAQLQRFTELEAPLLVGVSRKTFLGRIVDRPVDDRLWATAAAVAIAVEQGAGILRVHDVAAMKDVVQVATEIRRHMTSTMRAQHA